MAQWFRRWTLERATRGSIPARSVTLVAAVTPGSPVNGSSPPWLKAARARGFGFQKGGSNVTNQPSVSEWVVKVLLWPSGLGVGLWSKRPGVRSPHGPLHYICMRVSLCLLISHLCLQIAKSTIYRFCQPNQYSHIVRYPFRLNHYSIGMAQKILVSAINHPWLISVSNYSCKIAPALSLH